MSLYSYHCNASYIYIYIIAWLGGQYARGNIQLEGDSIGPTEGRDNTAPESWMFPHIARPKEVQIILLYDFTKQAL